MSETRDALGDLLIGLGSERDSPAVTDARGTFTNGELLERARLIEEEVRALGLGGDDRVGVRLPRDRDYVAAVIGVLRAGCAFVPLDPMLPEQRLEMMCERSGCMALVTGESGATPAVAPVDARWRGARPRGERPVAGATGQDLAYALFTSGSTGEPKCVLIERRNIAALLAGIEAIAPLRRPVVGSSLCPTGFDVSIWEILSTLTHGGHLHLCDEDQAADGIWLAGFLSEQGVTNAYIPPALLPAVIESFEVVGTAGSLERVLVGVEPIADGHLSRLQRLSDNLTIVNGYGPTETTVCATAHVFKTSGDPTRRVPIGRALPGYELSVVDEDLEPVAAGVPGELLIGGAGVGRGYADDPGQTRGRFLSHAPGITGRAYRSGDFVVAGPDGELTFVGRRDAEVKLRGHRVDLAGVESALMQDPVVRRAVARVINVPGGPTLVGFVEGIDAAEAESLKITARRRLAGHEIPDRIVSVDRLPLAENGKLDEDGLIALARGRSLDRDAVAPTNARQERLVDLWRDLLGLDHVGIDDDFLELGGHSLAQLELVARLRASFGLAITLADVRAAGTIRDLGDLLDRAEVISVDHTSVPSEPRRTGEATVGQVGLWVLGRLGSGRRFCIPFGVAISGLRSTAAIAHAVRAIAARHDALRTRFEPRKGKLNQVIEADVAPAHVELEARGRPWVEVREEVIAAALADPPELDEFPWRFWVVELSSTEHVVVMIVHHAVFDGWSQRVFIDELAAELSGEKVAEPRSVLSVHDEIRADGERAADVEYWEERLREAPPSWGIAADAETTSAGEWTGRIVRQSLSPSTLAGINRIAALSRVTPFELLAALVIATIAPRMEAPTICVSIPVALRDRHRAEGVIGYLVNLLPLFVWAGDDPSLRALAIRVHEELSGALEHGSVSFERMARMLPRSKGSGSSPLTRVMIAGVVPLGLPRTAGDLSLRDAEIDLPKSQCDLGVYLHHERESGKSTWEYDTTLFKDTTISGFSETFNRVTELVAETDTGVDERIGVLRDLVAGTGVR